MSTTANPPPVNNNIIQSAPGWIWIVLIAICVLLATIGGCRSCNNKKAPTATGTTNAVVTVVTNTVFVPAPLVVYATTPATLSVEYTFNIESDGKPIVVTYSNGKSYLYDAKKTFPTPPVGPKTFSDPNGGNVAFRIYRVR